MKRRASFFGVLAMFIVVNLSLIANAYTVDGDLSDWGIDNSELANGLCDTNSEVAWIPDSDTADWVVEDDVDDAWSGYAHGVHIRGTGATYTDYNEPKIQFNDGSWKAEPYGGEGYDIEAMYFDDETGYAYIAIVLSSNPSLVGDLAIDLDKDNNFEYGVKIRGVDVGEVKQRIVCKNPVWSYSTYFPSIKTTFICPPGSETGTATVGYFDSGVSDHDKTNYVVEIKIPKSALGNPADSTMSDLHSSVTCGNDHVELGVDFDYSAPELPYVLLTLLMVSPAFGYLLTQGNPLKRRKSEC